MRSVVRRTRTAVSGSRSAVMSSTNWQTSVTLRLDFSSCDCSSSLEVDGRVAISARARCAARVMRESMSRGSSVMPGHRRRGPRSSNQRTAESDPSVRWSESDPPFRVGHCLARLRHSPGPRRFRIGHCPPRGSATCGGTRCRVYVGRAGSGGASARADDRAHPRPRVRRRNSGRSGTTRLVAVRATSSGRTSADRRSSPPLSRPRASSPGLGPTTGVETLLGPSTPRPSGGPS